MRRRIAAGVATLCVAAALPVAASAARSAPGNSQYDNPITQPADTGASTQPADTGTSNGGGGVAGTVDQVGTAPGNSLPFTGFDAGLVAVGGLALVGLGVGLRRYSRRSSH